VHAKRFAIPQYRGRIVSEVERSVTTMAKVVAYVQ